MKARTEAWGWAVVYGPGWGLAAAAWQDAHEGGRPWWAALFAAYTITLGPAYFGLQWRELTAAG